jgi:hypothetical protein
MFSNTLEEHLKDMGILEVKSKKVAPDIVLPTRKVEYVYNDPSDPITGEVPF